MKSKNVMNDDISWRVFFKRLLLGSAPQWWVDMLIGRALRLGPGAENLIAQMTSLRKQAAQVTELVESEEKAWQMVAKLRIELETTNRLRIRVEELEAENRRLNDGASDA